jgi:hypothetical protein
MARMMYVVPDMLIHTSCGPLQPGLLEHSAMLQANISPAFVPSLSLVFLIAAYFPHCCLLP